VLAGWHPDRAGSPGSTVRGMDVPSRELTAEDLELVVKITDLMPLGAVWTPDEGTQAFDPSLFGE
jgi:hypothetical protein